MSAQSRVAFEFTVDKLDMRHLKLWTFTLPKSFPICVARLMWQSLRESLQRNLDFAGVRTFELHPRGHGLHVHCLALVCETRVAGDHEELTNSAERRDDVFGNAV